MKTTAWVLLVLLLILVTVLGVRSWLSRSNPPELGLVDGGLVRCGSAPNCVSSVGSDADHRVAALPYVGDRARTQEKLAAILLTMPRMQQVQREDRYWRYAQVSALFRFIDDVEFLFDDQAQLIHVRSASRVGYSDLGVNRKRVEALRAALAP